MELKSENLLQNFYLEAGIRTDRDVTERRKSGGICGGKLLKQLKKANQGSVRRRRTGISKMVFRQIRL